VTAEEIAFVEDVTVEETRLRKALVALYKRRAGHRINAWWCWCSCGRKSIPDGPPQVECHTVCDHCAMAQKG
jgi:hypothetical protein